MSALLEVHGLHTEFRTPDGTVHAVNGIDLTLAEGETLGIVGESGCGKSVTALSIMRLLPRAHAVITAGTVRFHGRDLLQISDAEMREVRGRQIAMIFQDPLTSLNPVLTINRQISEAVTKHLGLSKRQARDRAVELLDLVGISDPHRRVDDYPHQFSGGMRQRAMIAIALSCNPRVLIADEPTTALDVTIQAQIVDLVSRLQKEFHMAVIWITHDLGIVAGIADRVNVMYAGRIIETATVDEIFDNPRHPYTLGLLRSVPRLDEARRERLQPIEGLPPDLMRLPSACPFEPRCVHATPKCREENPALLAVNGGAHLSACWHWRDLVPARSE